MKTIPNIVIVGQIPPPWHGQAVATKMLFDYDWPGCRVTRIRMAFSGVMDEVGRLKLGKLLHLYQLIGEIRNAARDGKEPLLLYPPASPSWVPVLRDLILLSAVRKRFHRIVFLQHAGGLGEWAEKSRLRRMVCKLAYDNADLFMEVAKETITPHEVFESRAWAWTPYGVEVPRPLARHPKDPEKPCKVMFLGSLQEGKGVLEVLKTARLLAEQGLSERFRFVMVGPWFSEPFRKESLETVEKLGIGSMVEFAGQLVGDSKWKAFADSDIFFFPTHYCSEAFPLVLIEALGNGLPIVTTRWRGIPDMLEGCGSARLCDVRSPVQYRDAILAFAKELRAGTIHSETSVRFHQERYLPKLFLSQVRALVADVAGAEVDEAPSTELRKMVPVRADYPVANGLSRTSADKLRSPSSGSLRVSVYLADQNPGHDRSMGISRMSEVVLGTMAKRSDVGLHIVSSRTSQQGPSNGATLQVLPWGTRSKITRIVTDHLHPFFSWMRPAADVWYFPKGFLPRYGLLNTPAVVTVHDTIIQHYWDNYPGWRKSSEYAYWAQMLKFTLTNADVVFTVSENSRQQIMTFMKRHGISEKEILVTYEPCIYERFPQPVVTTKDNYVVHLASREPHKRTADLIRWWAAEGARNSALPQLHLVGRVTKEVASIIRGNGIFHQHPFLSDEGLRDAISRANALILPSEIEGFGLPAIEAYYLGTPVCFNLGTSIEEILQEGTSTGGFTLSDMNSLRPALEEVLAMPAEEIHRIGMSLRTRFASERIVGRMVDGLRKVAESGRY